MPVHYLVQGAARAPTVILAGSLGSTLSMWDRQVEALTEHFRVVRYDARGHGSSPVPPGPYSIDDLADDLAALQDTVGAPRAHIVGLSLGGMAAIRLAAREPARVDRLVLACTAAAMGPPKAWAERAAAVRAQGPGALADAVTGRWLTGGYRREHPADVALLVSMIASTAAEGYASCCTAIEHMDLRADLAQITALTLVIGGRDDPSITVADQQQLAAAVQGATLRIVDRAAHLASFEQPDVVNALLIDHLTAAAT